MPEQLTLLSAARPASPSRSQESGKDWMERVVSCENISDFFQKCAPRWFVWENVPGCLSSGGGADFAFILGQWQELGYHVAWRVLDAQYFGVAQRRRRVFAVGHIADWHYPAAVLFESDCMSGHPAPRRQAWKENSRGSASGAGTAKPLLTKDRHNAGEENPVLAKCLTSSNQRLDWETETLILNDQGGSVMDVSHDVTATLRAQTHGHEPIVFEPGIMSRDGGHVYDGVSSALRADPGDNRPAVCVPVAPAIGASGPPYSRPGNERVETEALCWKDTQVRRITPLECERLQGFPDEYTDIPFKGKPAPDGARYKALGNSMAVPCMRWIGERIQMMEEICQ